MGTHPILESDFDCLTDKVNSDNSICHQSLIQPLSSKSSSELLVEKLVPPPHWPQRRLVMISAKLLVTGKDSKSQSSLPFKTDRLRSLLFHPPLQWSSRPSKNHHVTERRSRTSNTMVISPWTTLLT